MGIKSGSVLSAVIAVLRNLLKIVGDQWTSLLPCGFTGKLSSTGINIYLYEALTDLIPPGLFLRIRKVLFSRISSVWS